MAIESGAPTRPAGLFLHIGLPKTGTTFLQNRVLPRLASLHFLCKPRSGMVEAADPWQSVLRSFFDRSPSIWGTLGDRLFAELLAGRRDDRDVLVSDENLSPTMRYPRSFLGPERADFGCDPHGTTAHLHELVGVAARWKLTPTRVLVTVRRQDNWLASTYAQASDRWPHASQQHFEGWVTSVLDPSAHYWTDGVTLDFVLLRRLLAQVVGDENVLVLPYELMKEDLGRFLDRWLAFLGLPQRANEVLRLLPPDGGSGYANARSTGPDTWRVRPRNERGARALSLRPWRLFRALGLPTRVLLRWPERGRGDEVRLTPDLRKRILATYEESNRELAAAISLDLGSYGYY